MSDLSYQFLSSFIAMSIPLFFVALMIGNKSSRSIILYFCWGLFAGILAFNINNYFGMGAGQSERLVLSVAPMVEEICKGLPLLLFLNKKRYPQITKLIIYCAMAIGIGFSIQESMYYFAISSRELSDIVALTIRTFTTALMHGMTTAAIGMGLMFLHKYKQMLVPLIFGLFALSASIHALYNLLLQTYLAVIVMVLPVFMFVLGWWIIRNQEDVE